jgi:hypothetical protein
MTINEVCDDPRTTHRSLRNKAQFGWYPIVFTDRLSAENDIATVAGSFVTAAGGTRPANFSSRFSVAEPATRAGLSAHLSFYGLLAPTLVRKPPPPARRNPRGTLARKAENREISARVDSDRMRQIRRGLKLEKWVATDTTGWPSRPRGFRSVISGQSRRQRAHPSWSLVKLQYLYR